MAIAVLAVVIFLTVWGKRGPRPWRNSPELHVLNILGAHWWQAGLRAALQPTSRSISPGSVRRGLPLRTRLLAPARPRDTLDRGKGHPRSQARLLPPAEILSYASRFLLSSQFQTLKLPFRLHECLSPPHSRGNVTNRWQGTAGVRKKE